jgi:hypothetical protein
MHKKYSTTFFSKTSKIVTQPANKTKFQLGFMTLLVGIVASSNTAIAQTVSADRNEHHPFDRMLVSHQHLTNQESGNSKNINLPNRFIAGDERRDGDGERRDRDGERRDKPHDKPHDDKPTNGGTHGQGVIPMPNPKEDDGSGRLPHRNKTHSIMTNPKIDDGSGDQKTLKKLNMPKPPIDDGSGNWIKTPRR